MGDSAELIAPNEPIDVVPDPWVSALEFSRYSPTSYPSVTIRDADPTESATTTYIPLSFPMQITIARRRVDSSQLAPSIVAILLGDPFAPIPRLNEQHFDINALLSLPLHPDVERRWEQRELADAAISGIRQAVFGQWLQHEAPRPFDDELARIRQALSQGRFAELDRRLYEYQAYRTPERDLLIDYMIRHARKMGEELEPVPPNVLTFRDNNPKGKTRRGKTKHEIPRDDNPTPTTIHPRSKVGLKLKKVAKKTNVPYAILVEVYRRGMGAWASSGSRMGQGPHAWAMARVNAFVKGGKTRHTEDKDLHNAMLKR